eukprot:CAMPEP_0185807536 /NCGR_PEP_ID=MMETSP1322-20130828/5064_1 /TAXON_ID=265543 /ORGANISM="Minutocellus polymorphus, Strain RCC2270" /LENGTH=59 /DNA_ID=CAMNT_0028503679 /DNA_START=182 /DNA_END=357 /DNA_ORIENTATION=+
MTISPFSKRPNFLQQSRCPLAQHMAWQDTEQYHASRHALHLNKMGRLASSGVLPQQSQT